MLTQQQNSAEHISYHITLYSDFFNIELISFLLVNT